MSPSKDKQQESSNCRKKILLVDDNWVVGSLECEILEHFGYQVDFKTDPVEALDHFQRKRYSFDLVITDMDMPKMTGDQLALEIVKIRKVPVVMCTGSNVNFSKEEAAKMGIKAVIMKPVIGNELKALLHKVIYEPEKNNVGAPKGS